MRTLDELMEESRGQSGVLAVLGAADRVRDQLRDAQFRANQAPAPKGYLSCICGAEMLIRSDVETRSPDEWIAIEDFQAQHSTCEASR